MFSLILSVGVPLAKKYGKTAIVAITALYGALHIWYLEKEISSEKAKIAAFEMVQKKNEDVILTQNKAIQHLWIQGKKDQANAILVGKTSEQEILIYKQALRPLVFKKDVSCAKGVKVFYNLVQEALK